MAIKTFELTFGGGSCQDGESFPKYRRHHPTIEAAEAEAQRVREIMEQNAPCGVGGSHSPQSTTVGSHQPIIYHPDGSVSTVRW